MPNRVFTPERRDPDPFTLRPQYLRARTGTVRHVGAEALTIDDLSGNPHPHLARLRAASPVAWVPVLGSHLVTGRLAALDVLRDPATFTVDDRRFSTAQVVGQSMLSLDGADHARHRHPFVAPFRPRQVDNRFGGFVTAQVDRLLERIAGTGSPTAELRTQLAGPLAAAVVAESIGLKGGDDQVVGRLLGWYREIVSSVSGVAAGCPVTDTGRTAMAELSRSLSEHISDDGSLLGDAVSAGGLSTAESISNAAVIMFGGIETTEAMILNVLWHLLGDPEALAEVRSRPEHVTAAVEESLRLEPAAAVVDRYATRDVELAGTAISKGDMVTVSLAGANRDPDEFTDPDRFDLHRKNLRRQLAFAAGPHVCVGMDLARLEATAAVSGVLARFPAMRVGSGAPAPTGLVFRKPDSLPVVLR
ncbi:cytochrome P450 [soil metagenome]